MAKLLQAPTKNAVQKTLASQLLSTSSTGDAITFSDVDGIANAPGVLVIDRVDSNGDSTPSSREYIEYSGTSGNTVIITTRNVDGSNAAITHQVGAIVEFIPDVTWAGRIHTALSNVVDTTDLSLDTTKVTDLTTAQTLTNKTLTSPVLNTGVSGTAVLDEDDMASDSATKLATQQSIKAYVDTSVSGISSLQNVAFYTANNTVTHDYSVLGASAQDILDGSSNVFGASITLTETTDLLIRFNLLHTTSNNYGAGTSVYQDSTVVYSFGGLCRHGQAIEGIIASGSFIHENVPAGTYTYKIKVAASGSTSTTVTYYGRAIEIIPVVKL